MLSHKVKFVRKAVPTKVELIEEGPPRRLRVEYKSTETGEISSEEFNTVSREQQSCQVTPHSYSCG